MEAASFVLPGASPVVPATSAPGLPRHSTGRWQGLAGLAGPCVAATAAALSAATRRTRCARVVRSALSDNPWEDVNKRTRTKGKTQGGAPWFAPGWGEEGDEDEEEELERKKPVEESVYCCWVMPKKKAADFLKEWAEEEEASDEQKDLLQGLASAEFEGWTVWGLSHASEGRDPGFYLIPPGDPQILAVVEALDEEKVDVQHVAVKPSDIGKETKQAFLDWVESLRPKLVVVKRPKELYAFDLGVEEGDGKGMKKVGRQTNCNFAAVPSHPIVICTFVGSQQTVHSTHQSLMFGDVEARCGPSPCIWYNAHIRDLTDQGVLCCFEEGSWDDVLCKFEDVRLPAPRLAPQDFDPVAGDLVEYEIFPSDAAPGGWAVAQVHARLETLWHLRWPDKSQQGSSGEVLMPRSRLRPCSSREGNVAGVLQKAEVTVDVSYARWLDSPDAAIAFRRVECMAVGLQTGDARCAPSDLLKVHCTGTREAKVIAIGTKKAVQRAKMLIPSILQNQEKVKCFEEAQQTRLKALLERQVKKLADMDPRRPAEGFSRAEFALPKAAVGRFIGKSGANIQAMQKEHTVRIVVEEAETPGFKRVHVLGQNEEDVHAVRDMAEVITKRILVEKGMKSWILGRNGTVAERVQIASGASSVRFDDKDHALVVEGTRSACATAQLLCDAHLSYFETFKGFDETMEDLVSRLKKQGELRECVWPPTPALKGRTWPPEGPPERGAPPRGHGGQGRRDRRAFEARSTSPAAERRRHQVA
ncbi:Fragile X mental retardation syndrome-related protein 2 [Symbiodinium microadriaticum]|uniref:Fragile X mental retardation syndrome-related protein 2 n=1 Tax=Symbiodinium microadriaticum TaxID=2951 RepID=A0A1Q9CH04_SYMMI|nr:Fragile X mental retardation syndrome-related protein 2 [Symbiodinium microadriaticum]